MVRLVYLSCLILLLSALNAGAQERIVTIGLQYRPIIPVNFFGLGDVRAEEGSLSIDYLPQVGSNLGVTLRKGLNERFSIESGISFTKRNYNIRLTETEDSFEEEISVSFIGYEIPLQGLLYVQVNKEIYLNVSTGFSLDFFPSNIEGVGERLIFNGLRFAWFRPAFSSNIGAEYRTPKSGYFYLGFTYHRPFDDIMVALSTYDEPDKLNRTLVTTLNGQYLTLDLRYFFNEPKQVKKPKKK